MLQSKIEAQSAVPVLLDVPLKIGGDRGCDGYPRIRKTPRDFVVDHSYPGFATVVVPLDIVGGHAVFAAVYEPAMKLHPAAIYDLEGNRYRPPTQGVEVDPSSGPRFRYVVKPIRPLRSRRDVIDLAEYWTRRYVNVRPISFVADMPAEAKADVPTAA